MPGPPVWTREPVKQPYWSRDPFSHLFKDQKKKIKYIERYSSERMKIIHPNGELAMGIPPKIIGRFVEPESMTQRRKGRVYMDPIPSKMKEPEKIGAIYRGRGRVRRLERDQEEQFKLLLFLNYKLLVYTL